MPETRVLSERYERMARGIIESEECLAPLRRSRVRIAYLSSDAKKATGGRTIFGRCEKVPSRHRWAIPYDFAIVVYEPNVAAFDEGRLRTLLLHELMHVGVSWADDGEEAYSVVPHDVEEFRAIIERHGLDWQLAPMA